RPQRQGSLHTAGRAATARHPGVGARVLHHGRRHARGGTGTRRPGGLPATDPRRYRVHRLDGLTRKDKGASVTVEVASGGVAIDGPPDWVRPLPGSGIEAVLDAAGAPAVWSGARLDPSGNAERWPLPAPLDPRFLALTRRWLHAVGTEVVRPYRHPHGPVRLVQIANEGLYTNGAQPLWAFDY